MQNDLRSSIFTAEEKRHIAPLVWIKTMFAKMSGRHLAGWGYGTFWAGLLFETANAVHSAMLPAPLSNPIFWVGQAVTVVCVVVGIGMLMGIRYRPW